MSNTPDDSGITSKEEQDRIRLKRLAKLSSAPASSSSTPTPQQPPPKPTPPPKPIPPPSRRTVNPPTPSVIRPAVKGKDKAAEKLNLEEWEAQTIRRVLGVTLDRADAEHEDWNIVWLKDLMKELQDEDPSHPPSLSLSIADRLLIARLSLDPNAMSDDPDMLIVLMNLPPEQTVFEYLVGCWVRLKNARSASRQRNYLPADHAKVHSIFDELKHLIISYAGLNLQGPEDMFPQPSSKRLGAPELVGPLLALSAPPLNAPQTMLAGGDVQTFLSDLAQRFDGDGLEDILGPVVVGVVAIMKEGQIEIPNLMGNEWRMVVAAFEALVAVKPIASMLPAVEGWNPAQATAPLWELVSLLGPLLRLSAFPREWPNIGKAYFANPPTLTRDSVDASNASLRTTLNNLQGSLFHIFNATVRSGNSGRDGTLALFARVLHLNWKRAGLHVDPTTVASDGLMVNLEAILHRFAEPFVDAHYSKMDRIDPLYFAKSKLMDVSQETRVLATSEDVKEFYTQQASTESPNFISNVFYLLSAYHHLGFSRTIGWHDDLNRSADDLQRHLERFQRDTSWQGTPMQAQMQAQIDRLKADLAEVQSQIFSYQVQLLDPDMLSRVIAFSGLVMAWLVRLVDPLNQHPTARIKLPLPQEVPANFKVLPEYFIEDVADFYIFVLRMRPPQLQWAGKDDLITFVLTFLSSTWYIRNPYLKSKLISVLSYGCATSTRGNSGPLADLLNTHPLALEHLMPALMAYYVDCESTGTHTQFYDKFEIRRNITMVFKAIWQNPVHRAALDREAQQIDRFVRFINLLRNDVTYLLDESLSKLQAIVAIQHEMEDRTAWMAQPPRRRQEQEAQLRSLEGQATSYFSLGRSTINLLKEFTAETKAPFMTPEIVDRLASTLDDNLGKIVGPRMKEVKVKDPERYRFQPRELLTDLLTIYLNLSNEPEFVKATARDLGYYRKEVFEAAFMSCKKHALKTDDEIEQLRLFVVKVEETKALFEGDEEEMGEIPDEFQDPIMATIMRDPVILPSSRAIVDRSTIKAHLLSDPTDPFNRMKLSIDEVIPDTELKARIDEWLASRKNKGVALSVNQDEIVNMDADEQMLA